MLVLGASLVTSAPAYQPEDDLVALAPVPADVPPLEDATAPQATPIPSPTRIVTNDTQFERVLRPLLLDAKRRRQANAVADPTYWTRLDPKLNSTRLNF